VPSERTSACFSAEESAFRVVLVSWVYVKNCRLGLVFVCAGPRLTDLK
jgi:hypothetical protein